MNILILNSNFKIDFVMKLNQIIISGVVFLALSLLVPSCAINPVTGKKQVVLMSEPQEIALGAQNVVKFLSYFIQYNGQVFSFHGVAAAADFNNFVPVFRATMEKFDKLTDPAKLNVKPKRIKIYEVKNQQMLADVFKNQKVTLDKMKELALLNNLELTDRVEKGRLIKLIGE